MRYLLDTHIILWWLADDKKLSRKVYDIIADKNNKIYVSSVSIWEMVLKQEIARLSVPVNILSILKGEQIQIIPLNADECLGISELPKLHNDPFDRAIIMQAKFNDLVLITKDQKIIEYPIVTLKA